jgi:hypothetical protein
LHEEGLADDDLSAEHQRFVRERDRDPNARDADVDTPRERGTSR